LNLLGSWFAIALSALLADAGADDVAPGAGNRVEHSALPQPPSLLSPIGPHRIVPEGINLDDLKEAKDGSGDRLYQGNGFSARVAPDGSVAFSDKNVTGLSPIPFWPMDARMGVPSLQSSVVSLLKGRRPPKPPPSELDVGLPPPETKQVNPDVSRYRPDPRENCRECTFNSLAVPVNGLARFDLADQLERFSGKDPFRYQKAVFLAATHEQRVQMAARTHARAIRQATAELPARLQGIACDGRLTYRERRAIMTALAAEMDTTSPDGAAAQRSIRSFLAHFDAGEVTCTAKTAP
jgi:hypothetical protein